MNAEERIERLDLRGVRCPLNWAKARVRLEQLASHAVLELIIDDPRGVRDIPRAAEASGYLVTDVIAADERCWRIRIVR